jgi:hypothetical protein
VIERIIERTLRDLLQLGVQCQDDVVTSHRRRNDTGRGLVFATFTVFQHNGSTGNTGQ